MSITGDILRSMLVDLQSTLSKAQTDLSTFDAMYQTDRYPLQQAVDDASDQVTALEDAIAQVEG